jgi:hypothetical protein
MHVPFSIALFLLSSVTLKQTVLATRHVTVLMNLFVASIE